MSALDRNTQVAVIGAGAMGAGIAQVAAQAGHPVKLYDNRPGAAAQAVAGIDRQLARLVEKGKLPAGEREAIVARLCPADTLDTLADARLVIEAIVENLSVKQALLHELEALCADDCILASNTSSLSITSLAAGLKRPQQVVGMHFFNPAPLMALVEVVSGLATDPAVAASLYDTAKAWGKQPVHARSTPGFIVNRVARPFYAESLRLLQEGAADCASLDALLRDAGGFRMGAFELTDLIGHDVNYAVTCSVFEAFYGDFRFQPSLVQKELVDAGRLGRKTGQGFYSYAEGAERPQPTALQSTAQVESCVIEGHLGAMQPLVERLRDSGIAVTERAGSGVIQVGDATLALSDGRLATQRAREEGLRNLVLVDLALDYSTASRIAISWSADTTREARDQAVGLLTRAGLKVTAVADLPGLVVLRTVAMLANEAADAVLQGVGSAADIDLAMRAGVNYPCGPLAWASRIGISQTLRVLDNLQRSYGESRYRPSLLLRRCEAQGGNLHD
ncbi:MULTISPECIES: 3-hydroxyacyl-CoA dehydrogenase PaaH [unclassified Pseudomonas]|jgi:3-hydroxybutyryl-CoA dehydrogenase|uniref:3-hydroxyacyl-CoA dehydrogenase PaaH n=1 Tax=unclassified Pseudomonas TaxID=196821 RepID=UPI000413A822|nr:MULTISPECIES: 3-hydroxyacyl-CoA dehydrogenase PaaH [unclassified Pseudomonas]SMF17152.1 3-hydroxyacyl-CoA dehydrogenase [Pseudomonas sp. LAIL14HWK12:I11]SMR77439.1 3-hydroxybutyryl-CoA dehydrogenase [Pseudomonas sp. LAIL14HWK12:I10]SOD02771.1 3-hydroxybutyryl-CoA dehydrogenase [Pseudomonas sp. LAIL14HWK12:I8]